MKLTTEIIHEESPGQRWLRLRHDFRQANQQRVHDQLVSTVVRTSQPTRTGYAVKYYKSNLLPEVHDMRSCQDDYPAPIEGLDHAVPPVMAEELDRHMAHAAQHTVIWMPSNVDLPVEDVDGPPIYNLDDEEEIFRAIDKMIGTGDD